MNEKEINKGETNNIDDNENKITIQEEDIEKYIDDKCREMLIEAEELILKRNIRISFIKKNIANMNYKIDKLLSKIETRILTNKINHYYKNKELLKNFSSVAEYGKGGYIKNYENKIEALKKITWLERKIKEELLLKKEIKKLLMSETDLFKNDLCKKLKIPKLPKIKKFDGNQQNNKG